MKGSIAVTILAAMTALAPSSVDAKDSPYLIFRVRPKTSKGKSSKSNALPSSPYLPPKGKSSKANYLPSSGKARKEPKSKCVKIDEQTASHPMSLLMDGPLAEQLFSMPDSTPPNTSKSSKGSKGSKSIENLKGSKGSKGSKRSGYDGRSDWPATPDSIRGKAIKCDEIDLPSPIGDQDVIARDDHASVPPNHTLIDVLQNDLTNPRDQSLILNTIFTSDPSYGTCAINEEKTAVIYSPPSDPLLGEVTCQYEACIAGNGTDLACDTANLTISIEPVVVARDDEAFVLSMSNGSQIEVLENDSTYPSGHSLIVQAITAGPSHGNCTLNEGSTSVIYSPPSDFIGEVVFEYEACIVDHQESKNCDRANATISVNTAMPPVTPIPGPVTAMDDEASILSTSSEISINVLENDITNPADKKLIVKAITMGPSHGNCTLNEDSTAVIYSPPSDPLFIGEIFFEYEACIVGEPKCDRANVTISVNTAAPTGSPTASPIIAVDDEASVLSTSSETLIEVLENDVTNPADKKLIVKAITMGPSHGNCTINEGSTAVIYSPPSDFIGQVFFEYEACIVDEPKCDRANVTISVDTAAPTGSPTASPVIAMDDEASVLSTSSETLIEVLENDITNPADKKLIVKAITMGPSPGNVTINEGSTAVIYSPPSDFIGQIFFEYEACIVDEPKCDRANVTISVNTAAPSGSPTASPIIAMDDEASVFSTSSETLIEVLENDITNPADKKLIVKAITMGPSHGNVTLNEGRTAVIYSSPSDPLFIGETVFEYEACVDDGIDLKCDRANVTISISTRSPTQYPTKSPTPPPSGAPSSAPSMDPTKFPTDQPTKVPTNGPTKSPTLGPTSAPSNSPTQSPTEQPSEEPTDQPTKSPTPEPTDAPSKKPTGSPTAQPTKVPTNEPTKTPTLGPTSAPSSSPTKSPTEQPSKSPTMSPTNIPSKSPTKTPTKTPSASPTKNPTQSPTWSPSKSPTSSPTTATPTVSPSTPPPIQMLVCISDRHFKDAKGRTCKYYKHPVVNHKCLPNEHNTNGWVNAAGETPWEACCYCGGGSIGLSTTPALITSSFLISNDFTPPPADSTPPPAPARRRLGSPN